MARLARLAHRIVWVNPRVGARGFLGAGRRDGGGAAVLRRAGQRAQLPGARRGRRCDRRRATSAASPAAHGCRAGSPSREDEPWASATPVPGSSVAMPSGHGPSKGNTTPGWVTDDDDATIKICIYPGCERPAVPPHPLGGPQPAFCDLEEHNALTAHQERQRLASRRARGATTTGGAAMANEAYRAVFLRVHPTGKMVLSLTTESDGKESAVRAARRRRARRPRARRQGRARRHRPLRRRSRLQHEPVGRRAGGDRRARPRRSATRRSCSPAWRWTRRPRRCKWVNGAWVGGDGGDPTQVKTIEDIALYAHGTGALPPASRAGSTRRRSTRD